MVSKVYFSEKTASFYLEEDKQKYNKAQSWPDDAKEVPYKVFEEYALSSPPEDQVRGSKNGQPCWVSNPLMELNAVASELSWCRYEMERARDELEKVQDSDDKAFGSVAEWRTYRKALRAWPEHENFPDKNFRPINPSKE